MIRILVADRLSPRAIEKISEIPEFEVIERIGLSPAELAQELAGVEAVIIRGRTVMSAAAIAAAPTLQLIVRAGTDLSGIDLEAAEKRNIEVRHTPLASTVAVAELAIGLMLALCRQLATAARVPDAPRDQLPTGQELAHRTLGILGFGRTGSEVARRALAFGMKVVYADDRLVDPLPGTRQLSRNEVLESADILSIHLPLTDTTRHLIGKAELARMKPGALLVHVSRGAVVDLEALRQALTENRLGGAALDCLDSTTDVEGLRQAGANVWITPRLATYTGEIEDRFGEGVISILKEFFNV